jgi:hypothetical protein
MACDETLTLCVSGLITGLTALVWLIKHSYQLKELKENGKNK